MNIHKLVFVLILALTLIAIYPAASFAHEGMATEHDLHPQVTSDIRKTSLYEANENAIHNNNTRYEVFKRNFKDKSELKRENIEEPLTDIQEARLATIKANAAKSQARILKATDVLITITDRIQTKLNEQGQTSQQMHVKVDMIRDDIEAVEIRAENLSTLYENIEGSSTAEIKTNLQKLKQEIRAIIADLKDIKADLKLLVKQTQ